MSSRNFTNKLWNAGKFILFNLEQLDDTEWQDLAQADFSKAGSLTDLPLAERWVVSALHQVRMLCCLHSSDETSLVATSGNGPFLQLRELDRALFTLMTHATMLTPPCMKCPCPLSP